VYRLSQEREPNAVHFSKQRSASSFASKVTSPGRSSSPAALRLSKSHEDILSPFNKTPQQTLSIPQTTDQEQSKTKKNRTLPNSFRDSGPLKIEISDKKTQRPPTGKRVQSEESGNLLSPVDVPERRGVVALSPSVKRKFIKGHKKASSLGSK